MAKNYLLVFFVVMLFGRSQATENISTLNLENREVIDQIDSLAKRCWSMRESNSDSALILGKTALALAMDYKLYDKTPKLNGYIGVILVHYLYDLVGAIPYFQESLRGSLKLNDSVRLGYAYNNLGDVYMLTGNIPLALQFSEKSLDIFNRINHDMGIAYGNINMGLIHRNEKNYNIALDYFRKAADIRSRIDDKTGYASALLEIARTHIDKGDIQKALTYYENSYKRHTELNNKRYTAYCLDGMAKINYHLSKFEDAERDYLEAISLNESRMSYYGLIDNYLGVSLVYAKLNKVQKGESSLQNALNISTRLGLRTKILDTYEAYTEFYKILKNYEKAAHNSLNFLVLYDSIYSVQQYEILSEIEANYIMDQNLKQTKQQLVSTQRERLYLIVIVFLLALIIGIFLWRNTRQNIMNKKLISANNTKDKLLSVISHDIRSPFSTIIGFNELLIDNLSNTDNEQAKYYAEAVQSASTDTLNLVNNMLTWSRSQIGGIKLSLVRSDIYDLFKEIEGLFETKANKENLILVFNNKITRKVNIDRTIIQIVLSNLISNAIKYTPSGGKIEISAKIQEREISLCVKDTGVGIPKEALQLLLADFSDIQSTPGVRNEKGTGLGLTICKDLLKVHKGTIFAESTEGQGSTFTAKIPV